MKDWLAAQWRSAGFVRRLAVGALAVAYVGSGLFPVELSFRRWIHRHGSRDVVVSLGLGLVGLIWLGSVVALTTVEEPAARTLGLSTGTERLQAEAQVLATTPSGPSISAEGDHGGATASPPTSSPGVDSPSFATATSLSTTSTVVVPDQKGVVLVMDLLASVAVQLETQSGYDRDLFVHWIDEDGDGCDTREEVLIRDAGGSAQVDAFGCAVVAGDWYSVYDDVWVSDPTQLEIDHVVPLKEAWDSGAKDWDAVTRQAFANDLADPRSLIAVTSASNGSKGAADPSNWLPPNSHDRCRYIAAWVSVKVRWALSMDESEYGRIRNLLNGECVGLTTLAVTRVFPDIQPAPATRDDTSTTTTRPIVTTIRIEAIVYDGPGKDVHYNDSEYVVLRNTGNDAVEVGGWVIADAAGHQIAIPLRYSIPPGAGLRIHTGPGDNTTDKYFAAMSQAIWNNSGGDTATLYSDAGSVIDTYSYTR